MQSLMRSLTLVVAGGLLCALAGSAQDAKPADIDRLIKQLGDEDFGAREDAMKRLAKIGAPAMPALRKAEQSKNPEIRDRSLAVMIQIEKDLRHELLSITGQRGYWLNRVAFAKDGKHAIATGGGVIWYDLATGKEVRREQEVNGARPGLALSSDGRFFVTSHAHQNTVLLGNTNKTEVIHTWRGHGVGVMDVAFAHDGGRVVSAGNDKTVRVWDARKNFNEIVKINHGKYVARAVAFAPNGKQVASGAGGGGDECPIYLWDAESGAAVKTLPGHKGDVASVLFTPDGKRLLSAGHDGALILWDISTGKELKRMWHGADSMINRAAISPDGKRALTAGFRDHTVRLWDLEDATEIRALIGHEGAVLDVAFSADGKRALSTDSQCTLKLWKLPD